jgi:hypothetical protein
MFVKEGLKQAPIWSQLRHQIYLGDEKFVARMQQNVSDKESDVQIPKIQKRAIAKTLQEYEKLSRSRDDAISRAYASGAYSYQVLGDYFGLHFTRIGRIVRMNHETKKAKS